MCSGIDYLSAIYSKNRGRRSFEQILVELGRVSQENAEALYQLRCALFHRYSLKVLCESGPRKGKTFHFQLNDRAVSYGVTKISETTVDVAYGVSIIALKQTFCRVIGELEALCRKPSSPRFPELLKAIAKASAEKLQSGN